MPPLAKKRAHKPHHPKLKFFQKKAAALILFIKTAVWLRCLFMDAKY